MLSGASPTILQRAFTCTMLSKEYYDFDFDINFFFFELLSGASRATLYFGLFSVYVYFYHINNSKKFYDNKLHCFCLFIVLTKNL